MKIVCDACSAKYSIADDKVRGKVFKIRCKKCSNIIVVRGSTGEEQPPAATFDQKETRVFDYSGYDDPNEAAQAAAAAASSDAVWHLVIDQEQVGPMSPDEVRKHYAAGDIDSDSYIWREGFGDWEPLASVEMFADIESSSAPAPAAAAVAAAPAGDDAVANMFGGPSVEDNATARSDPADLFSAASGESDDVGADLFGGGGDAESAMGGGESMADSLFGSADDDDESGMDEDAEQQLRGQRNENSVLFSLNNLAALASPESKSAAAPLSSPSSSSSSSSAAPAALGAAAPGMAQSGGGEGSGLIDIRAMAGAYLGPKDTGADLATASAAEVDDLPVFSQTSFDQPSAVLLPTGASQGTQTNKLLYILLAVIGVLVVSAVVLVIVVVKGGSKDSGKTQVAAVTDTDLNRPGTDPKPEDPKPEGDDPKPEGDDPKPEGDDPEPEGDDPKPAVGDKKPTKKPTRNTDKKPTKRPTKKPTPKPTTDPKPTTSGKCIDEVACLLADNPPSCCSKYGGGGSKKPTKKPTTKAGSDLPERLSDRGDIKAGISKVRGKVTACGDKHAGKGQVKVSIKVAASGSVASATVKSSPNSALGSCVASAVKKAKFRKTQKGGSFTYPFVFR